MWSYIFAMAAADRAPGAGTRDLVETWMFQISAVSCAA
jgi:hypothetical protein